jgi:hypothetical protein
MLAQLSHWILIATLSQAPPEAAWLNAIPADVDVAIRTRGLEASIHDFVAMLNAMNPAWGKMAEDGTAAHLAEMGQKHGEHAVKSPWVGLIRLGDGAAEGGMPFAILVGSNRYPEVLKELVGGKDPDVKHQDGNYDAFDGPEGQGTWYAAKGPGIVAFGPSKALIASIAKPGGKTLDKILNDSAAKPFLSGDVGVYVNAAALATRYADQIEQGRQAFMGALDQAAQQPGGEAMMKSVKDIYGGLFDSIKYADALTLSLDVAEKGLHLTGVFNVKADAPAAKSISGIHTSPATALGNFPSGSLAYLYMDLESKTFEQLKGMSLRMLSAGKPSPELEKAMAELDGLGRIESLASVSFANGMSMFSDMTVSDPKKYVAAQVAMLQAMKGSGGPLNLFKDVKVDHDIQAYQGLNFTRIATSLDMDKLSQLGGNNPAGGEAVKSMMKSMYGGDTFTYWYGTDGKRLFQVMGPSWESVKPQIDGYLKGAGGIGETPGFKAVRSELPAQASLLAMIESQSLARMYANLFATMFKNPDLKVGDDLPKEPAFLGMSVTPRPPVGYEIHLVIPSSVGTVVDKGLVPIFRGLQPPGANP